MLKKEKLTRIKEKSRQQTEMVINGFCVTKSYCEFLSQAEN